MAKFKQGESGNPNGRPQGAMNKLNKDLRKSISEFLNDNFDEVITEWKKPSGKDKVTFYRDLLQYEVPKKQAVSMHGDGQQVILHFDKQDKNC